MIVIYCLKLAEPTAARGIKVLQWQSRIERRSLRRPLTRWSNDIVRSQDDGG